MKRAEQAFEEIEKLITNIQLHLYCNERDAGDIGWELRRISVSLSPHLEIPVLLSAYTGYPIPCRKSFEVANRGMKRRIKILELPANKAFCRTCKI